MTTLLTTGFGQNTRRCDAKCYNAHGEECECICEGMNHGVGLATARDRAEFGGWGPGILVNPDLTVQEELEALVIPELEEALKKLGKTLKKVERSFEAIAEASLAVIVAMKNVDWDDATQREMKDALDDLEKQLKKERENVRRNGSR